MDAASGSLQEKSGFKKHPGMKDVDVKDWNEF